MTHEQPIDREIAPLRILLRCAGVLDSVRMPPIGITDIRAKRGNLNLHPVSWHGNHAKLRANRDAFGKNRQDLLWSGIRRYVVIDWRAAQQEIAHTSAHQQRL